MANPSGWLVANAWASILTASGAALGAGEPRASSIATGAPASSSAGAGADGTSPGPTADVDGASGRGAGDDPAERPGFVALMFGLGTAYDLAGMHLELGGDNVAVFVGTGAPLIDSFSKPWRPGDAHDDLAIGLRFFTGSADRFFFSLQWMLSLRGDQARADPAGANAERTYVKSGGFTAGWRWRFGRHLLMEAGAGAAIFQGAPGCALCTAPIPDLSVGFGYRF